MPAEGKLPNYREVRALIESIPLEKFKLGGMFGYLIAGRASEIVARAYPSDKKTTANGPYGADYNVSEYEGHEVLVLNVKTSKREGLPRDIGVPLSDKLEPFAKTVLEYFEQTPGHKPVFDYTRQELYNGSKDVFKGYVYPIEPYTIREVDRVKFQTMLEQVPEELRSFVKPPDSVVTEKKVARHFRPLALHGSMRHYRTMELVQRYGLNKEERDNYTGHKTSGSDDRYSHLNWRQYFPKLLV
jgi:hypothetical protein